MKVFISWSKNSRDVGKAVSDAVTEIFAPVVNTFISQEIRAGSRALEEIDEALDDTDFGIICLTRANQAEQWINYEAGALSRQVGDKRQRMGVFLVDFDSVDDVNSPLNIFQCKYSTLEGFSDLMKSLNELKPNVKDDTLTRRIGLVWPDVEAAVSAVKEATPATPLPPQPAKTTDDRLDELTALVKAIEASLGDGLATLRSRAMTSSLNNLLLPQVNELITRPRASQAVIADAVSTWLKDATVRTAREFDVVVKDMLEDIRKVPGVGRASTGMVDGELRIRTDGEVPEEVKNAVIARLEPYHAASRIVFLPNSFSE